MWVTLTQAKSKSKPAYLRGMHKEGRPAVHGEQAVVLGEGDEAAAAGLGADLQRRAGGGAGEQERGEKTKWQDAERVWAGL